MSQLSDWSINREVRVLRLVQIISFSSLIILGTACNGQGEGEEGGIKLPAGADRPAGKWSGGSFPLSVKLSNQFSQTERDALAAIGNKWEDLISNEINFFTIDADNPVAEPNYSDTNNYNDGTLGIYKSTSWPGSFGTNTLAVTQSFGYVNQDSAGYFIEMVHADIIFNYQRYTFSLNPAWGQFDLESVALHELGHFIGMKHDSSNSFSVMYPSIGPVTQKRNPSTRDEEVLRSNYRIGPSVSNLEPNTMALKAGLSFHEEEETDAGRGTVYGDVGTPVKIIIELKADGTCEHYANDKLVHTHKSDSVIFNK